MNKSDSIVIIPTYNERENIEKIIRAVLGLEKVFDILEGNIPPGEELTELDMKGKYHQVMAMY